MNVTKYYARYLSTHFNQGGRLTKKSRDQQTKYYHRNIIPLLPADKQCRIIDLGCGLGHFLHALQAAGYQNILGVDASAECVEFCQQQGLPVVVGDIADYLQK
ncbi:MAG: class I SAM-dependent methyltransferase, partial [Acidobacteriota bacterium]